MDRDIASEQSRQQWPWNTRGFGGTAGIQACGGRRSENRGAAKTNWPNSFLTSECFFLEDKSRVVSYKLSTKFLRHGTFTSFFTACTTQDVTHSGTMGLCPLQTSSASDAYWGKLLTAATGTRISTKRPAKACLMSLSLTSRKYWAHSCKKTSVEGSLSAEELPQFKSIYEESKKVNDRINIPEAELPKWPRMENILETKSTESRDILLSSQHKTIYIYK